MSKTYWLVSSNSVPIPEKKDKTLVLHGVNAYDIQELVCMERHRFLYIKKSDVNLIAQHLDFLKQSETLSDKIKLFLTSWHLLPQGLKWAIPVIIIYLVIGIVATIISPIECSICIAFISTCSTALISLMALFYEEKIFGPIASLLIGGACGYILFEIYIYLANMRDWNIAILSRNSIGNLLTIISLVIVFIGYTKSLISIYMNIARITLIEESNQKISCK